MPRYNQKGQIAAGIGGTAVSIDQRVIAQPAGGADWLDDESVIYARKTGEPDLWGLRAHNGLTETVIDDKGATHIYAGGGAWAADLGPGYRSNAHPASSTAGLKGMGPDGTLAFCDNFHDGRGLKLRSRAGTITEVLQPSEGGARDVQVHGKRDATWITRNRIRSTYGTPVVPDGVCHSPRVVVRDGNRLLLYILADSRGERLILQTEWNRPVGYVLVSGTTIRTYRPDLVIQQGTVYACWATSEGEGPASIQEKPIGMGAPVVSLLRDTLPLPPEPPPMPNPNRKDLVKKYRQAYDSLSGTERAFRVVNATAWELRGEGAGILSKPSGNNFQGYAVDIIVYPDGRHYDVLGDAEGDATPVDWRDAGLVSPDRWRSPKDPQGTTPPPPPGPVPQVCQFVPCSCKFQVTDLAPVLAGIDDLRTRLEELELLVRAERRLDGLRWVGSGRISGPEV